MKFKLLVLAVSFLFISGCASGVFAGNYQETIAKNKDGTVLTNRIGMPVKERKRTARSVSIMEHAATAIKKMNEEENKKHNACLSLTFEQINQLKADAQAEYLRGVSTCNLFAAMERTVSQALGRPQSPQEAVARAFVGAVEASERGMTGRIRAIANPLAVTIGVKSVADNFAEVGKAKGHTSVGNINVSDSGDSGEGNTATSSTNLIIGDGNSATTGFDSATVTDNRDNDAQTAESINNENGAKVDF